MNSFVTITDLVIDGTPCDVSALGEIFPDLKEFSSFLYEELDEIESEPLRGGDNFP